MGVRGLTGFIARHAELYLTPYKLHDCNLVIDGDNLACNLYKDVTGINSAFGGDYDAFYRGVVNFFLVLAECNIKPYVLMDGGYEYRKLRTVGKRMRSKISAIKCINPCASIPVFPLMMKEVFVDALEDCGVSVMRCEFEADDELAALGRKLNCPVLSYDSDFYIYNVKYIPLITLTVKAHTKFCKSNSIENDDADTRKLRKNEANKVDKRTKCNRVMDTIVVNNKEKLKKGKSYKYLDCCMYRIENLIERGSLSKEKLPLFAAMLGNDYIKRSCFKNFFLSGMGKVGRSRKTNRQQRRIKVILKWLKTQTAESALQSILSRLKKRQRRSLVAQVNSATRGYSNETCRSYDYFRNCRNLFEDHEDNDNEVLVETEDEMEEEFESSEEEDESEGEVEVEEEDEEKEIGEEDTDGKEEESEEPCAEVQELENGEVEKDFEKTLEQSDDDSDEEENDFSCFPQWFLDKLYPAKLPRFFVDLMYLRKYFNNPQIEHFPLNDSNAIALPILIQIYSLINNVKGEEYVPKVMEDGTARLLFFKYLTRAVGSTKIFYKHIEVKDPPKYDFIPETPNPLFLKDVYENNVPDLNPEQLFAELDKLPKEIRLYFLAIVYWLKKSQYYDIVHLHSLLVCLVVLKIIDSKIEPERDLKAFQKRFGKIIKKERQVRDKEEASGGTRTVKEEVLALSIIDRLSYIQKSDCYLVQNELLKHFHMQEVFKKKYDLFSSIVLHAFAEFQSVVFQLHSLNALLDFPYLAPRMAQMYCGVFLYNMYDLLKCRLDVQYYIKNFIFKDSPMMFDFYSYLWNWCERFIPSWIKSKDEKINATVMKKILKKKRQQARKSSKKEDNIEDPNADMLSSGNEVNDEFIDLNNKFCTFLKVR